jgi:hypothetical protein
LIKVGELLDGQDMAIVHAVLCSLISDAAQYLPKDKRVRMFVELMADSMGAQVVHCDPPDDDDDAEHDIH